MRAVSLDLAARPYARPSLDVKVALSGNPCQVPGCDRLAGDAYVCPTCVESWEVQLGNMTSLVEDLEIAMRKQARFGDQTGIRSVEPPLPFDMRAAYHLSILRAELAGQVSLIASIYGLKTPAPNIVAMSRWLLCQAGRVATVVRAAPLEGAPDNGADLVSGLDAAYRNAVRAIDTPVRAKYVCVCSTCGLSVWSPGAVAKCACGRVYDVDAEHEARMEAARDYLVTISEAATLAKVPFSTVQFWADPKRGNRLEICGERDGARLVRFGDVADLASARDRTA